MGEKNVFDKARLYTQGLLVSQLRNIEQISNTLGTTDYYQMQHFITESNRNAQDAIDMAQNIPARHYQNVN